MSIYPIDLIKRIEVKMLPGKDGRDAQESPKVILTREEQLIYADHLESIGHHKSAAFFRLEGDYGLNRRKEVKNRRRKTK
jgi:hypothetical protein